MGGIVCLVQVRSIRELISYEPIDTQNRSQQTIISYPFEMPNQYLPFTLYSFFKSSTAFRVRIAMNLKGVKPHFKFVNLLAGEQKSKKYAELNPNQGVPALELPDGKVIVESMAIIEFLDEIFPNHAKFFPSDPVEKAKIRAFCEVINSGIHPYQNTRLIQMLPFEKEEKDKFQTYWANRGVQTMEDMIGGNLKKFAFGDKITAADIFFYPQIFTATKRFGVDITKYPACQYLHNQLSQIHEFINAEPERQLDYKPV